MKIKEVIEKTKLTDRAIRLYIDNGLVSPGIEENYSGRKNIDFSENDVERLNQIALLRKAGFSISDIKTMISDDERIEELVTKFIEETDEEIKSKTEVVEKLKAISFDEKISLKTLCEKLSGTVEEINVPKEDLDAPRSFKIAKKVMQILSVTGIVISIDVITIILKSVISSYKYYLPTIATLLVGPISFGGLICVAVLCFSVLGIFKEKRKGKENRKTDTATSVSLLIISAIIFIPSLLMSLTFGFVEGCSTTKNPDNYLVVDIDVEQNMDEILEIFPGRIPSSLHTKNGFDDSVKYCYYFERSLSAQYKILAEWTLNENEYLQAKETVPQSKEHIITTRGDWTLLHFLNRKCPGLSIEESIRRDCNSFVFAYNDKEKRVRYIASLDYSDSPYYKELDW